MLAIGLNPSTANEDNLDPTSRNIQAIAQNNGCDGWWLVNLYTNRTSKPSKLPKTVNQVIAKDKMKFMIDLMKLVLPTLRSEDEIQSISETPSIDYRTLFNFVEPGN